MQSVAPINAARRVARRRREAGVYFLSDASRLLRGTDHGARAHEHSLSPQQLTGWARAGLVSLHTDDVFTGRRYVRFPDLVTLRMVAILRSHGISTAKIRTAQAYLSETLLIAHPFAHKTLWVDDAEVAEDIFAEVDRRLVTASRYGQMPFTELLKRKIVKVSNLDFDGDGDAESWQPHEGVVIDPAVHSGAPCIAGTRISTRVIYDLHVGGDDVATLAGWYEIDVGQVGAAIAWEARLAT